MQTSRRKIWLAVIALTLLALVIGTAAMIRAYPSKIAIEVSPADSTVTINGKKRSQGTINVRPGTYSVVASRQGFATQTKSVSVVKGETKYVGLLLAPNSAATANWYIDHPADAKKLEGISSKNFDLVSSQQLSKYPIIKDLPLIDQVFRIDYGRSMAHPDDPIAIAVYVKYYSEEGKPQALEWLKFKGYSPDNLEIIYVNAQVQQ